MDLPKPPQQSQLSAPSPDFLALFTWRLRKHPLWQQQISKLVRRGVDSAYQFVDWLAWEMTPKVANQLEREYGDDPEAFCKQQFMIFHSWPEESKDSMARAALFFETNDKSVLEKAELIIKAAR